MKRLNKFIAILLAAFGVQTLSAQSWTAPVIGEDIANIDVNTELYMYNVKADAFACAGMSWGTHAIVKELQNGDNVLSAGIHNCKITRPEAERVKISLNGREWLGGGGPASTNDCWVDHAQNNLYIYNNIGNNTYKLKPTTATNDSYLDCSWAYGGHITFSATNGYGNTEWAFVKRENITNGKYLLYKAKKEMYDIYAAVVEAGHDDTYSDALSTAHAAYTSASATSETVNAATKVLLSKVAPALTKGFYPVNSLFDRPDMRGAGDDDKWGNGLNAFGDGIFESWHSAETITQTKTGLPNGFYTVVFHGIYRQDGSDAAPTLKLTSGTNSAVANLKAITDIDFGKCNGGNKWTGDNKPDDKYTAGEALAHTDAVVRVENFVVENGELTVTVSMPSGSQWLLCQGFEIFYKAESVEEYANLFKASKAAAEAIDKNALNEAAKNILNTALANAAAEEISKDWYNARIQELDYAVALAKAIAAQMPIANALVATCESYLENSTPKQASSKTAFETAIVQAKSEVNGATTAEALTKAINNLEAARQLYVVSATPNGVTFDLNFKMTNNWTNGGNTYNAGGVIMRERYFEDAYLTGNMMTQTISGLANGIYNVELYANANWTPNRGNIKTAAADAGAEVSSVFANEITVKVPLAHQTATATAGQYKLEGVEVKDGTINLGIRNDANGANWILIAPKSLTFVSALDLSELIATLTNDLERANAINGKMSTAAQQQLAAAIEGADVNSDNPDELDRMISELQKAIAAAETSISDYAKIKTYIEKANKIDASIAANYQTQYNNGTLVEDAETIRQELSVATFNYVKENFKNEIQLTTWGAESNAMWSASGEHWDGTTGEGSTSYYDANGTNTTHTLSKTVELTPGTYVFRGAGRSNTNTTLSLSISLSGVEPVVFNAKGNTGRGIDKEGNATFADEAQYARDGQGQGWEWEFIKFTLNEKTSVTLTATCKTTGWGWASFANNGLWMDDATYVVANKGALSGPKANAEALVDTKPMGAAENAALKEAISRAEGTLNTPADLNGAIDALNKAVEAANAWVQRYNEEKVPLVEALERFETDFNLEGTPNHKYMSKNAWNNVLDMVKEAALAKDVTDSYEGFADAANNLNAALDAAQKSINTYANFAAEISYAKAYTPIVSGNIAGHTASINAAETAYNAAEIEDPSELILAMQNYRVQDYNYVKENYTAFELTGDWTGQTNLNSGEHWSDNPEITYFDYSKWSPNNIDGANEATLTTTLPAGEYILMAAGRAAAIDGTEAYIKVDETKVNFAAKSNRGYGIDVNGDANFATATDNTYAMNNEGYGWEYRFIAFTLEKETEVKLVAGMTIDHSTAELSWAGVCTPVLYITPIAEAKARLQKAIDAAENAIEAYAVGEEAFRVSESSEKYVALEDAIATAKNVINTANTVNALNEAIAPLESATENYRNGYVLNAPEAGQRFRMIMDYEGWEHHGKAVTYLANNRNDMGMYNIQYYAAPNNNYAQAFTFTPVPVDGQTNCYTLSMTDVDGNERYVCTGTVYDGNAGQLRTTTDPTQALAVKVIATTTAGIYNLWNTKANNYIGGQDAGFFTVNSHINFNIQEASMVDVTLTISSAKWSTLILPFNAELPEGVKAYTCAGVIDGVLTFNEDTTIVANTPYLVGGNAGEYDFSGYGLADKDVYTEGLFTGTYVNYPTESNKGIYVLQKHDNVVAFYLVGEDAKPLVRANRCYITYEEVSGARMLRLGFGDDDTTGIDNMQFPTDNSGVTIYDTMGRKVTSMKKGNLYIMNGRKVVVK